MYQPNWRSHTSRMFGARLIDGAASLRTAGVFATGEPELILVTAEELRSGESVSVDIDIAPNQAVRCVVEIAGNAPLSAPDGSRTYWADIVKFVGNAESTWQDLFFPVSASSLAMAA